MSVPTIPIATIPETTVENNVDQLIACINIAVGNEQITAFNILSICINLMQIVEKFPNLKGSQKKELVLRALDAAISQRGGDKGLIALIPSFIDNAISIQNGNIQISVTPEEVAGCCIGILSCFSKKENAKK